jgi:flagellar M-ring protein FliF
VPDLNTKNVSVVDQNGTLLSADANGANKGGLDNNQLKYRSETEQSYVKRIEAIIAPVLGNANVRAQVSAELDFSEVEQAEESYKPNQKPDQAAVRTSQTSETTGADNKAAASGVPGALTNQPPNTGGAPVTAAPADAQNPGAAPGATTAANQRRDAAVAYEVDKSIRHTKVAQGQLKRLSVAVVVNDRKVTDSAGKVTSKPLTDAEKQQITDLVKGVMGYDKDRGDTLSVINSAFNAPEVEKIAEVPMWKDPGNIGMAKDAGKYLLIAAAVLFVLMRLKPIMKNLASPPALPAPLAAEVLLADAPIALSSPKIDRYETALHSAKQIAKQDPKIVANVVKDWVAGNE